MDQLARLLDQRLGDGGMGMAQRTDGDAPAQVEVALPGEVIDITARAVTEHNIETAITRDHILRKQRLHRRDVIPDHGRRRGNNLFHRHVPVFSGKAYAFRFVTFESLAC